MTTKSRRKTLKIKLNWFLIICLGTLGWKRIVLTMRTGRVTSSKEDTFHMNQVAIIQSYQLVAVFRLWNFIETHSWRRIPGEGWDGRSLGSPQCQTKICSLWGACAFFLRTMLPLLTFKYISIHIKSMMQLHTLQYIFYSMCRRQRSKRLNQFGHQSSN